MACLYAPVHVELELIEDIAGRAFEPGRTRSLGAGDRVEIRSDPLVVHQGLGRPAPPGALDAHRRLALDDASVTWGVASGHCQIWSEATVARVRDSGSDNGTFIERDGVATRVAGGQLAELRPGDVLRIGRVALRVLGD